MKDFEKQVISLLLSKRFGVDQLERILDECEELGYEYTGSGYYLNVSHPEIPKERSTWSEPPVVGRADSIVCGFVVFIDESHLTLECHSWGELEVPEDFRTRDVHLTF